MALGSPQSLAAEQSNAASTKATRVAYLNTCYPSLSHTFIEREIRAVRGLGLEVHTFSIRRPNKEGQLSERHRKAVQETFYLLDGCFGIFKALFVSLAKPMALIRILIASQRLASPGIISRLRHLVYSVEAIRLSREMARRALNHVHVHMANNGAAVALLATVFNSSLHYSLSIHGSAEFFHVDSWNLKRKVENAAFVRCISSFCQAQVMTWTSPLAWPKYHIVHCGVDITEFLPRERKETGRFEILTIGRIEVIKGYPILLQACRGLGEKRIDWHLNMIGSGPLLPYLQSLARDLDIESRITFTGAVGQDEIQQHINRANVMVVSSFMEGIPVVLMEAMAKELTVIATKVGGIPELIDDRIDGLLVTTASSDALETALQCLSTDREFSKALGRAAARKIATLFSLDETGRQMAALFEMYIQASSRNSSDRLMSADESARADGPREELALQEL